MKIMKLFLLDSSNFISFAYTKTKLRPMKLCLFCLYITSLLCHNSLWGQSNSLSLRLSFRHIGVEGIKVILDKKHFRFTDSMGVCKFEPIDTGAHELEFSSEKYRDSTIRLRIEKDKGLNIFAVLTPISEGLKEYVVTGTLKQIKRSESPVNIEVYTPSFFKKNPSSGLFEAMQNINGIRPQVNCNVCNTGDIHINGLEGPYTMVLIDGMPLVSSLSTVYGLSGIPSSMVERIEIIKGPASTLYGSEAIGGVINVISKRPINSAKLTFENMSTSWGESNTDIGHKLKIKKKIDILTGINHYWFDQKTDKNNDQFTDVTQQHRLSIFQKINIQRKSTLPFQIAGRYFYENRWGGDIRWSRPFRLGDSIYAESIFTSRVELFGNYQLPIKEKINLSASINRHHQNSAYGIVSFIALQKIAFLQGTWDKDIKKHCLLLGAAYRYTYYDDNTVGTQENSNLISINKPQKIALPGIFIQDLIKFNTKNNLLLGFRIDLNQVHGKIYTPRLAYKHIFNLNNVLRINSGTGFRVVNLFTEDHAALTGARSVVIKESLNPERSVNLNINYLKKHRFGSNNLIGLDMTVFYTHFSNRIQADYLSNSNFIYYDNINGYSVSSGFSANIDLNLNCGVNALLGLSYLDIYTIDKGIRKTPILTEKFTGTWTISYPIKKIKTSVDYTGNIYSPMQLPTLGDLDPRNKYSPWWSIQNIQLTYTGIKKIKLFGGVKNLLNFTPMRKNSFIIARAHDPFDKKVEYGVDGQIKKTLENPYALSFDPNYVYAPNQGIRFFIGFTCTVL